MDNLLAYADFSRSIQLGELLLEIQLGLFIQAEHLGHAAGLDFLDVDAVQVIVPTSYEYAEVEEKVLEAAEPEQ